MSFKYEVDVAPKLDPFAVGHCEEVVVVQGGIEGFDPLRINVPVAYHPRGDLGIADHFTSSVGQDTIVKLPGVHIDVTEKLWVWVGAYVHVQGRADVRHRSMYKHVCLLYNIAIQCTVCTVCT